MTNLGINTRRHMLKGHDWFSPFKGDDAGLRATWNAYRDVLLREWVTTFPGTRPWAWWAFDAPELRRRVDGHAHPFDDPERQARVESVGYRNADATRFGVPTCYITPADWTASYEAEDEYLNRLDLLTCAERETLSPLGV